MPPGDLKALLAYTKARIPAFVNTFGALNEVLVSAGAGAIALGFPVIVDADLAENQVPGALISVTDPAATVKRSLELRNIKIKAKNVPICMGFASAFENEIIRKADVHAEFYSGANPTCEPVIVCGRNEIEDHRLVIEGLDIEGTAPIELSLAT